MISDDDYIRIGVITGAHGLDGRVKVFVVSDIPDRFAPGADVMVSGERGEALHRVNQFSGLKGRTALLRLDSINDRDAALSLKGSAVYIERSTAEKTRKEHLDNDSFYYYDLIGCRAFVHGGHIGEVIDVFEAGAGSILVIRGESGKDMMVPFVEAMVDTSRISEGCLDIEPVEGLFDI